MTTIKSINYPSYPKIRLGLCCMNMTLRYVQDIHTNRKRILKTIMEKGLEDAKAIARDNVVDLLKMFLWNKNHGIDVMRISSELVPHGTNIQLIEKFGKGGEEYLSMEFLRPYLKIVGEIARLEKMRLTFHPGQFVQIGTPNETVFVASVRELEMHAKFLDMMEQGVDSVMVVHLGGTYNDKQTTLKRFVSRFKSLPDFVKNRLVLENDEKCYDADDVINICEQLNVPMVFDIFHYYCYKKYHPDKQQITLDELIPRVLKLWKNRGIRPKFHLSEQMENKPVGSHSLFVEEIPEVFLQIPDKYGVEIDIMIEAKGKEVALGKLYQKYPNLKSKYTYELPTKVPRGALKDLKLPPELRDSVDTVDPGDTVSSDCGCDKL